MTTAGKKSGVTKQQWQEAHGFFAEKLVDNPTMPKYNVCMAALYSAKNDQQKADYHYKVRCELCILLYIIEQ